MWHLITKVLALCSSYALESLGMQMCKSGDKYGVYDFLFLLPKYRGGL